MPRAHLGPVGVDDWQAQMRIHRRVTLAREVLGARRDPCGLQAPDPGDAVAGYEVRVLAVGADADIRAVALREDIEHRGEIHVDAQAAELAALEEALPVDEGDLSRRAYRQIVREDRDGAAQHDDASALVIRGDEKPPAESLLEAGQEARETLGRLEVAPVEHDARRLRVAEQANVGLGQVGPREPEHETPPHQRFEAHRDPLYVMRATSTERGLHS